MDIVLYLFVWNEYVYFLALGVGGWKCLLGTIADVNSHIG